MIDFFNQQMLLRYIELTHFSNLRFRNQDKPWHSSVIHQQQVAELQPPDAETVRTEALIQLKQGQHSTRLRNRSPIAH